MATSPGFTNNLPNILSKIVKTHIRGQTMGTENVMLSIEESIRYICGMLDEVSLLAHTIREEFNGDLNGAVQSEMEILVETLATLTKLSDAVN